jgi:hypothetical protein
MDTNVKQKRLLGKTEETVGKIASIKENIKIYYD